jgi:hypothetical protein
MTDRKILDTILRWCKIAEERQDCDELAQNRFKEIRELIDRERKKRKDEGGGWL